MALIASIKQKFKDLIDRLRSSSCVGIFYAVLSTFLFTYAYFAAQQVAHSTPNFPILELVFVRCAVQLILLLPIIVIYKKQVFHERERWWSLLWLTLVGYWCLVSGYWSLNYVPASILLPISATCPLFAIAFSYIILKEKAYAVDGISGIIGFIGVVVIFRPTFIFGNYKRKESITNETIADEHNELSYLVGCLIALLFGAGTALLITLIRKWNRDSKEDDPDQLPTILYPSVFGLAVTPILMIFSGKTMILPISGYANFALFMASICSLLGSYSLACALRTIRAPVVGIIRNLDIVWIFLLQYAVVSIWPSLWSITGAVFIVIATILVCFRDKICKNVECFKCYKRDYEEIEAEEVSMEENMEEGRRAEDENAEANKEDE